MARALRWQNPAPDVPFVNFTAKGDPDHGRDGRRPPRRTCSKDHLDVTGADQAAG
jgi:hypothetical protein